LRWHQSGEKACDLCQADIARSDTRWRCEEHCDYDVCVKCYSEASLDVKAPNLDVKAPNLDVKAPNLDAYFELRCDLLEQQGTLDDVKNDPFKPLMNEMDLKSEPLKIIVGKSFDFHDKNNNGILDEEESQLFFQHFVDRFVAYYEHHECLSTDMALRAQSDMLELHQFDTGVTEEVVSELIAKAEAAKIKFHSGAKARAAAYAEDRTEKNNTAFKVLDVNKDSKLTKEAVVDALFPDTVQYFELMAALGMLTPEDVESQQRGKAEMAELKQMSAAYSSMGGMGKGMMQMGEVKVEVSGTGMGKGQDMGKGKDEMM